MIFVNAFFAHRYFNLSTADFNAEIDKLACRLMANHHIQNESGPSSPNSASTARSPTSTVPDTVLHTPIPLRLVPGYKEAVNAPQAKGGKQQRCVWCNGYTTMACECCSTGPHHLVPICPESTTCRRGLRTGQVTMHLCAIKHAQNPHYFPKGNPLRGAKRARGGSGQDSANGEACDA